MNTQPTALRLADLCATDVQSADCDCERCELFRACGSELRRQHAENEALRKSLRWHIRVYRVADDAWDADAELERLYQREMKK